MPLRRTALSSDQQVHGKAAETQVLVRTDWIAQIAIRRVTLLVTKAIDRHGEELDAVLEVLIHMGCRRPVYTTATLAEGIRSSLVAGKSTKSASNDLEALLDSFRVIAPLKE